MLVLARSWALAVEPLESIATSSSFFFRTPDSIVVASGRGLQTVFDEVLPLGNTVVFGRELRLDYFEEKNVVKLKLPSPSATGLAYLYMYKSKSAQSSRQPPPPSMSSNISTSFSFHFRQSKSSNLGYLGVFSA
ncbi:Uncharacterized protein Fot_28110 [Forsythia ovata]|uniref:Uncharacterized protein n=1 Tax=Forsythia ovata TaxID=205694 RepID=A0ABD1TN25_9LAMI